MDREWPTKEECYAAMAALAQDYFTGAQLAKWQQHIDDGLARGGNCQQARAFCMNSVVPLKSAL